MISPLRSVRSRLYPVLALVLVAAGSPGLRAQGRFADLPAKMQVFVDHGDVSGIVTLVATKDRILHLAAVGESDLATGRKLAVGDYFWIASMSKPMTAVGVAILADEGKLSFDDPVEKYLPEFHGLWMVQEQSATRRVLVPSPGPITLRQLLTHTSGLGEYAVTDPHWTLAEMVRMLSREPLRFAPGSRWAYSTAGIDTLGRVIEVVSGQPFAQFMQTRVFDPLGMTHITFWLTPEQAQHYARSYIRNPQTGKLEETVIHYMYGGAVTDHARPALGGAGLFAPAEDVAKFYQMALNGGELNGRRILRASTLAEMTRPQTGDLRARPGMPWGLGFCVITDPTQLTANRTYSPGSFGHGGAFGTSSWVDPTRGVITIIMLQRDKMGNPDNSPMRIAYQDAVAADLGY
jgi:CubicO group peptidase (beta-lactamase class C family)